MECAERFVRTLRENLLSIRNFDYLHELLTAAREFRRQYNAEWLLIRCDYQTPFETRRTFRSG